MKKLSYLFLAVLVLITGVVNVNAEEYASYKKGDKVTVSVNATEKLDFYVIEDSDSETEEVLAIYADVFDNPYTYEAAVEYLDTLKDEWENVSSVAIPSMEDIFGSEVDLSDGFKFDEPKWALSNYRYWTSTETDVEEDLWVWTVSTTLEGEGTAGTIEATAEQYLKPLINVSKESVVVAKEEQAVPKDETKVDNAQTGDMDLILFGGAVTLCLVIGSVSLKKAKSN